ncbi:MAG: Lrp/AsnC family transcriptional regulator [Chloroflexi bacterium]|nr:Lrp/AsnC family transcriptional regulator [Chloroflexota bacterium]MCZ6790037.1 Lrp/AsnC family transcriptional regulator [Chloroflexota bacterium]MCZ6891602.1 Lrp/AsnC family transcriptional regulator [Chloroflexota bacterium]
MDDLDRKLIELLQINGRASNASIARDVGVSEGTVRRRLRRLIQDGTIRVIGVPDPHKMGLNTVALVGIQTDLDKIDSVAATLAQLPQVQYVSLTTGSYDIFIWVAMSSSEELGNFLRQKVGAAEGIRRTETFVHLDIVKKGYGIPV